MIITRALLKDCHYCFTPFKKTAQWHLQKDIEAAIGPLEVARQSLSYQFFEIKLFVNAPIGVSDSSLQFKFFQFFFRISIIVIKHPPTIAIADTILKVTHSKILNMRELCRIIIPSFVDN